MSDEPPSDYSDALGFLLGRIDYEKQPGVPYRKSNYKLDRMRELLVRLGRPDRGQRIVHVTGTKGKGSVATMIAAVLTAAGYRSGLFTSPHLERIEERMAVDGEPCSPGELVELTAVVRPAVESLDREAANNRSPRLGRPTYFEITTALALLHFAKRQADVTVLEVGMGGRLDSTNVCQTMLSIITSISLDHTEQLGDTLAAIAREKAGIIKQGVPVVSGVTQQEPRDVIRRTAADRGCSMVELGRDFNVQYHPPGRGPTNHEPACFDYLSTGAAQPRRYPLALLGRHQATNAAVALAAIEQLRAQGYAVSEEAIRHGLANVRCPARVEVVAHRPTVVVDGGHNVASIEALIEAIEENFGWRRPKILIFAGTQNKDVQGMLRLLLPRFDEAIFTRYVNNPRGVPVDQLDAWAASISDIRRHRCDEPAAAWRLARTLAGPEALVTVTGSFFIGAELRSLIRSEIQHPAALSGEATTVSFR